MECGQPKATTPMTGDGKHTTHKHGDFAYGL